ncbi:MAG: malate synthase A [Thermoflexales bacterium]|nr:malate synthase A [Thermoflexales bacterium]
MSPIKISAPVSVAYATVLSPEALAFVEALQRAFNPRREALLARRAERQRDIEQGVALDFLPETAGIRNADWKVAVTPADLQNRRVEITGPVERKMMINALNSGAPMFMADLEDANAPTWDNVIQGQINLQDAIRRRIAFTAPDGREYALNEKVATLLVRPRGWHMTEKHATLDGAPVSASLFDFGLYFFHNARELLSRGSGPYFYLPKLESHLEARLWNDVFFFAEGYCGVPSGSVRATVLIETILGAFEMEEILYELRAHSAGLNAGRWDYIFSCIKKFKTWPGLIFPDRAQVTMTVPFMRAYTELLVRTCHKRGAHAIGGMAAFIPSRKDAAVNETALKAVRADKERESGDGFDGTWVAHPDLVPTALACFDAKLGERPHLKERLREEVVPNARALTDFAIPNGTVTEAGVRNNISVGLQYIESWLRGNGAAAINNLMEDAATAEISRSQLWQWLRNAATLADGRAFTPALYAQLRDEEVARIGGLERGRFRDALALLDTLVLAERYEEFLTLPGYRQLD